MTTVHEERVEKKAASTQGSDLRRKSWRAAFWYLLITITGPIVIFYFPSKFIVAEDAAATMARIAARPTLFRVGVLTDLVSTLAFLMTALALYELLKEAGRFQARVMVTLVTVSVSLALACELFKMVPLLLASGAGPLKAVAPAQAQPLAALSMEILKQGEIFAQAFWGLWLLPLAILVMRSKLFPKFLGYLQMVAGLGYVANFAVALVFPGPPGVIGTIITVMLLGELPFIFWLVFRGARLRPPLKPTSESVA